MRATLHSRCCALLLSVQVCVDAVAVLFMFDLTVKSTLLSVREWYRQVRGLNAVS